MLKNSNSFLFPDKTKALCLFGRGFKSFVNPFNDDMPNFKPMLFTFLTVILIGGFGGIYAI